MSTEILSGYGLAGLVIFVLAGVVAFLYKELKAERKRNDDLQSERLQDARDTRDTLGESMKQIAEGNENLYDFIKLSIGSQGK